MIKKGDFVQVEYSGYVSPENFLFDTTDEKAAKDAEIFDENMAYGPVTVCVGEGMLLKGIDEGLEGKEVGKEYDMDVAPEDGFGKKDAKLIQLIPTSKFKKQNINPMPGLQIDVDGATGTVKTVSGGRTIVDFNHPLSGKQLKYKVKVLSKVDDKKEQVTSYISMTFRMKRESFDVTIVANKAEIKFKKELSLPHELVKELEEKVKGVTNLEEVKMTSGKAGGTTKE